RGRLLRLLPYLSVLLKMINVLKIYAADGTLDVLHTLSTESAKCCFIYVHIRSKDIHHHGHLNRQLEQQTGGSVFRRVNRACHGRGNGSRQKSRSVARRNISAVKTDSFFNKLAPAFAVVLLLPSVNAFQCGWIKPE